MQQQWQPHNDVRDHGQPCCVLSRCHPVTVPLPLPLGALLPGPDCDRLAGQALIRLDQTLTVIPWSHG